MSCAISVGDRAEQIWMIKNTIYSQFVDLVKLRCSDQEAVSRIVVSEYTNGISLDLLWKENPAMALRVGGALRSVAAEVAAGTLSVTDPPIEGEAGRLRESFATLTTMLSEWLGS